MKDFDPSILEKLLDERGIKHTVLSKKVGSSATLITDIVKRGKTPRIDSLIKLANELNVTVDYLCGFEKKIISNIPNQKNRISEFRRKFQLSAKKLAELLKVNEEQLINWEDGTAELTDNDIEKIALVFQTTPEEFMKATDELSQSDVDRIRRYNALPEEAQKAIDAMIKSYENK